VGWRLLINLRSGLTSEKGAGTILAVASFSLVIVAGLAVAMSVRVQADSSLARFAADAAALSAADALSGYRTGHPCEVASHVLQIHRAQMVECRIVGFDIKIRASVKSIGMVHFASARAGTS
jgi:secretion/DNA translocation related TadE-like protein